MAKKTKKKKGSRPWLTSTGKCRFGKVKIGRRKGSCRKAKKSKK
jgi:hypothetical protein